MTIQRLWNTRDNEGLLRGFPAVDSDSWEVKLLKKPASNSQKKVKVCRHQGAGRARGDGGALRQLSDVDLTQTSTSQSPPAIESGPCIPAVHNGNGSRAADSRYTLAKP